MSSAAFNDLSFLDIVFPRLDKSEKDRYTSASWLRTDFESQVWICQFGSRRVVVDWDISVGSSGDKLTDSDQALLLRTFKCWLVLSTHADAHRGALWSPKTEHIRFVTTLDWIEYFIVRADELALTESGLACLSRDELIGALFTVAAFRRKSDSIYDFAPRLGAHLRALGRGVTAKDLRKLIRDFPFLASDIPEPQDRVTDLTEEEVVAARAALWQQGMYVRQSGKGPYEWRVPLASLMPALYFGTLRRTGGRRPPVELHLVPDDRVSREYPGVPITGNSVDGLNQIHFRQYVRSLRELGLLDNVGLPVPITSLRTLQTEDAVRISSLKGLGRFRTAPPAIVFLALRRAIEFVLAKGNAVVDVYLAAAAEASASGLSLSTVLAQGLSDPTAATTAKDLGVVRWTVRDVVHARGRGRGLSPADYYPRLRANVGLWDLLRVLYGAVQVIVGTLTARRVSELVELDAKECLDRSRKYLLFANAKSGVLGHRQMLARPIPSIAVRAIGVLQHIHQASLDSGQPLIAYPTALGTSFVQATDRAFAGNLDYFFDYIEMQRDSEGRRYYLRQHQLRRFFAMVFFWSNSFGGLDTLREFLGHTDAGHLYRYITESTPGEVLRGVKAEWAAEALCTQVSAADALADIVEHRFGTREFRLLESQDLADYIDDLLEAGKVQIEPEFLDGRGTYRIAVRVVSTGGSA